MFYRYLSQKTSDFMGFALIILMFIALCAEADMMVPAFPEMVNYFGTTENQIQLILSFNFAGLCIASLIVGPLSDTFGRRPVLLLGLLGFAVSSLFCLFAEQFYSLLTWRFIQGISASVPMVVTSAMILDQYTIEKSSRLVGLLNTVITAAMAGAPLLGAWLSLHFHWRANFVVIAFLTTTCLVGAWAFMGETLASHQRKRFLLKSVINDYLTLAFSFKYMAYTIIALLPFTGIVVYIANLSVIFINHLEISPQDFGYYQATTMGTYVIFSGLSSYLIGKKGMHFTKNLGGLGLIIGGIALFFVSLFQPRSPNLICLSMAFFAAGGALVLGIFAMKALEAHPEMKGTSSAMFTAIRQLLAFGLVLASECAFDGSIFPVGCIIFAYLMVAVLSYIILEYPVIAFTFLRAQTREDE